MVAGVLKRAFYDRNPVAVAKDLLGKVLIRETKEGITAGVIVEAEAYLACDDPANHAFKGKTNRNRSLFGPPGYTYVYRIHRVHCLNAVTEPEGVPSAVLIRALMPLIGLELMRHRLKRDDPKPMTGPGKLCKAMAIDLSLDGWDLTRGKVLWVVEPKELLTITERDIAVTPRIGISVAKEFPLRFFLRLPPFVHFVSHPRDPSLSGTLKVRGASVGNR